MSSVRSLVGPHIESLNPYVPGKPIEELRRERNIQGEILKMASNENPLGPSPKAMEAARRAIQEAHLYPDGGAFYLRQRLARHLGVGVERLVTGNGSNELLELIARTFCAPGDHVVFSQYAFVIYKLIAQACNLVATEVPTDAELVADLGAIAEAVGPNTRVIFLANPNNPTGTWFRREAFEGFLDHLNARGLEPLVVMDDAYIEFADPAVCPDSLGYHARYGRLITLRTFSKCYGLAALRVGYGVAQPEIIDYLSRVRAPFNTNRIGQIAATAALDDVEFVAASVAVNQAGRAQLAAGLAELGVKTWPSMTNFLLCRLPRPAAAVFDALLDRGVIVRPMGGYGLHDCVRVSVGTPQQNVRFLAALQAVLAEPGG